MTAMVCRCRSAIPFSDSWSSASNTVTNVLNPQSFIGTWNLQISCLIEISRFWKLQILEWHDCSKQADRSLLTLWGLIITWLQKFWEVPATKRNRVIFGLQGSLFTKWLQDCYHSQRQVFQTSTLKFSNASKLVWLIKASFPIRSKSCSPPFIGGSALERP